MCVYYLKQQRHPIRVSASTSERAHTHTHTHTKEPPGVCVITVRVRSKVESARRIVCWPLLSTTRFLLRYITPRPASDIFAVAGTESYCGFVRSSWKKGREREKKKKRERRLPGWISRKLKSKSRIMSGCGAREMEEPSRSPSCKRHNARRFPSIERGIFVKTKRVLALSLPRIGSLFNDESSVGISAIASNILPGLVRNVYTRCPVCLAISSFDRFGLYVLPRLRYTLGIWIATKSLG